MTPLEVASLIGSGVPTPLGLATLLAKGTIAAGQAVTTPGATDAPGLEPWAESREEESELVDWREAQAAGIWIPDRLVEQLEEQERQGLEPRFLLTQDQKALWLKWKGSQASDASWVVPVVVGGAVVVGLGVLVTTAVILAKRG